MTRPRRDPNGFATATINDVAASAGVSKRTVSRVLNKQPYITPDTRDRVLEAMQRLDYRPNAAARRLASGKSHLIGLFHPASAPPDPGLVEQLTLDLAEARYRMLVCSVDSRAPGAAEECASLASTVPVDGAILCAPLPEQPAFDAAFRAKGIPSVWLGAAGLRGVSADDREAARDVTRFLASLGHVRIGFVSGPRESDSAQQRLQGFQQALEAAGLVADPDLILQGTGSFESGVACGRRLLRDAAARPTAIIADSDDAAAGVLVAAHEAAVPVPDALSVIGFGDRPIARQVWPALSSVRPPLRPLATRAAALLLGLLGREYAEADPPVVLSAEIIKRSSTGVLKPPA